MIETSVASNSASVNEKEPELEGKSNLVKPSVKSEATTVVSCTRKTPVVPKSNAEISNQIITCNKLNS